MAKILLHMDDITKEFPGVKALDHVNFNVLEGEIHCLVGENGAGKSTLMKVLSGVHGFGSYSGNINLDGEPVSFHGIADSEKKGIAIIHQELQLFPELPIFENIFVGHEVKRFLVVNWNETIRRAEAILDKVGLNINPYTLVKNLSVAQQQLVEIAKALSKNARLLILDEPTASLNDIDSENLLNLLKRLREQGITIIMISHKLKEVLQISDRITVIRDGQTICTLDKTKDQVTEGVIIKHMVGREITNIYPKRSSCVQEDVMLEVSRWDAYNRSGKHVLKDISFHVKKGEIVGIAGLMGSGRTELALSLFGNTMGYSLKGEMKLDDQRVMFRHPKQAIKEGLAYVSEDRKEKGLILIEDVRENISVANLKEFVNYGVLNENEEIKVAESYRTSVNIKTPSINQAVSNLSGGNQQKVVISKWLFTKPKVLILDEPTRGIDVGAKYEIYTIMNRLVQEGMSIVMISSELPEVLGMSDRIYVMSEGEFKGELSTSEATQERIMELATIGGKYE